MSPDIAFVHTSAQHVATFERLVREADPALRLVHLVDEALLTEAQRVGADDPALAARVAEVMTAAAAGGAALVVCTCSTVGGAAERVATAGHFSAARIDRAMADHAVRAGRRILVAATLDSTLAPTLQLIEESAAALGRVVACRPLLVETAWPHFLRGELAAYTAAVSDAVRAAVGDAEAVVLAQASMAPAAALLSDLGIPVLASPLLGVERAIAQVRAARQLQTTD